MLKKNLPASKACQEFRKIKFASKTAKLLLIVTFILAVFFISQPVFAQGFLTAGLESFKEATQLPTTNLQVVVARIINAFLALLGIVAVLIIIYGGWLWMTAMGDATKVEKAKKVLTQAAIGLIIIILSYAIASFIMFVLGGGFGGRRVISGTAPDYGGGGGALGAGIIRSHYPARNATDVPRNTKIVVTFKEQICLASIITDDKINADNIRIYPKPAAGESPVYVTNVNAYYTDDPDASDYLQTFVFKPVDYLGNPNTSTPYVVELTNKLKKVDCKTPAFGNFGSYSWSFTVSTVLDLTPPQIKSVIPKAVLNPSVARNTVIQINFNEAIDPMTLAGKVTVKGGGQTGAELAAGAYNLITVKSGANYVAGEFYVSNQYRTVEFITNNPCGTNSCGNPVYCLPGNSLISVLLKAATLSEIMAFPYDGLVDMADNSLDGNANGTAQGPTPSASNPYSLNDKSGIGDNATWQFNTNDKIDLVPPQVESRDPDITNKNFSPKDDLNLAFDKALMFSSLIQEETLKLEQPGVADKLKVGYDFRKGGTDEKTTVIITTAGLAPDFVYNILAKSGIKDITQNCFYPSSDTSYCKRGATGVPGQYVQGETWSGAYPDCNLNLAP